MFDHLSGIDIPIALLVDLTTVTLAIILLLRYGRLSHSHPGTIYLFFHLYTFTSRLLGLCFGAETLFSEFQGFFEIVTPAEIARAALLGDLALAVMTIAWIKASADDLKKSRRSSESSLEGQPNLSLRYIWAVVAVAFPVGLFGLLVFANLPGLPRVATSLPCPGRGREDVAIDRGGRASGGNAIRTDQSRFEPGGCARSTAAVDPCFAAGIRPDTGAASQARRV